GNEAGPGPEKPSRGLRLRGRNGGVRHRRGSRRTLGRRSHPQHRRPPHQVQEGRSRHPLHGRERLRWCGRGVRGKAGCLVHGADEIRRVEKMEKYNEAIRKNSDGIADEIRKAQRTLDILLRKAKSTLTALNVELHEEGAERSTPITLPADSLKQAVDRLRDD